MAAYSNKHSIFITALRKLAHAIYKDFFQMKTLKISLELENVFMKHYAPNW